MLVSKLKFKKRDTNKQYHPTIHSLLAYLNIVMIVMIAKNEVIITYFLPKAAFNEFNANEELRR